jgi:hypothetical protein
MQKVYFNDHKTIALDAYLMTLRVGGDYIEIEVRITNRSRSTTQNTAIPVSTICRIQTRLLTDIREYEREKERGESILFPQQVSNELITGIRPTSGLRSLTKNKSGF